MASLLLGIAACFGSQKDKLTSKRHRDAQAKITIVTDDSGKKLPKEPANQGSIHRHLEPVAHDPMQQHGGSHKVEDIS